MDLVIDLISRVVSHIFVYFFKYVLIRYPVFTYFKLTLRSSYYFSETGQNSAIYSPLFIMFNFIMADYRTFFNIAS